MTLKKNSPRYVQRHCLQFNAEFIAGILEQSMGARNRVGIGLSYTGLPGYIGWRNQFLGSLKVLKYQHRCLGDYLHALAHEFLHFVSNQVQNLHM
jgi:hypothetical protein